MKYPICETFNDARRWCQENGVDLSKVHLTNPRNGEIEIVDKPSNEQPKPKRKKKEQDAERLEG